MLFKLGLLLALTFQYSSADDDFLYGTFPENFAWSCATSAYQIEGAWNIDGRAASIWDTFVHENDGEKVADGSNGDVACDSYHRYKEDVQLLKSLNVKYYRFSVSWPRILPDGTVQSANQLGVDYYNNVINELINNGITPQITLYHWDLPQALEDHGGWLNETTAELFEAYAEFCYDKFGDRVKFWITFNEPWITCLSGYTGAMAPGKNDRPGYEPYICAHHLLKAHAKAWHIYTAKYKTAQNGRVGITLNIGYALPFNMSNPADVEASERQMQFDLGWFAHPIYKGNYPAVMIERIANRSKQQGLNESRLPVFTEDEIKSIKGTHDFFGLNFYCGAYTRDDPNKDSPWNITERPNIFDDKGTLGAPGKPEWTPSASNWLFDTPELMRAMLVWIKSEYSNPPVYITENGFSTTTGTEADSSRVTFYRGYLNNVLKAIKLDHCNVMGYTAWSLMDNFEWRAGYTQRFGIHSVNFSDPKRPRTPKDSARYYGSVITNNGFPDPTQTTTPSSNTASLSTGPTGLLILFAFLQTFLQLLIISPA